MRSYPQAGARRLCDGNLGLGETRTGSPLHLLCLRVFYQCILWISLKQRLKAVHSNALYNRAILLRASKCHSGMQCLMRGIIDSETKSHAENLRRKASVVRLSRALFERSMRHVRSNMIWAPRLAGLPANIVRVFPALQSTSCVSAEQRLSSRYRGNQRR